ncbi:MAG: hypothetical protein C4518_06980 [Desulfobacteraceae bacterium]|nr:MAG: hypothetical protein C4518_06980 [Desulfobacteraceae bacterium]
MENQDSLVLRISKAIPANEEPNSPMNIILQRPYAHLLKQFQKVYETNGDIAIKVDERYGERRKEKRLILCDNRYSDRRKRLERNWQMNLIIQRQYAQLTNDLERVFKGQEDVNIVIDGRHRERRTESGGALPDDRRCRDRRVKSETLVEVILSY